MTTKQGKFYWAILDEKRTIVQCIKLDLPLGMMYYGCFGGECLVTESELNIIEEIQIPEELKTLEHY